MLYFHYNHWQPFWILVDFKVIEALIYVNNARNGSYTIKLVRNDILHLIIGPLLKRLYFRYGQWRPFWILVISGQTRHRIFGDF